MFMLSEYDMDLKSQKLFFEKVILRLREQFTSFIGIDPGAVIKLECAELIRGSDKKEGTLPEFWYGRRMRYTGLEDAYQRRYAKYTSMEDALKKTTVYTVEGRVLCVKEIEAWLYGDQYSTDTAKDLQYLELNKPYL